MSWWNPLMILTFSAMIEIIRSDTDDIFDIDSDDLLNEIVGGTPTNPSNYPYIVSLQANGHHFCGGSVLRKSHPAAVLTAAHCYKNFKNNHVKARIYAKDADGPFNSNSNKWIDFNIEDKEIHPDYNPVSWDNDIMILFLSRYGSYGFQRKPLQFVRHVQTVTIQLNQVSSSTGGNLECCSNDQDLQAIGYGRDCTGCALTPTLEYVDIGYVSRDDCKDRLGSRVTENMNCAAELNGGKGICEGDSGGPLIVKGTRKQVGIASWTYFKCAYRGKPGVYVDVGVPAIYNWIQQHVPLEMDDGEETELMVDAGETALESLSGNNYWVTLVSMIVFVLTFIGGIWYCYQNGCSFINGYSKDMYQPISLRENDSV